MSRSRGAGAALDFFIWGSGHAYLGRRKALGIPWVVWTMFLGIYSILDAYVASQTTAFYYIDYSSGFGQIAYNSGEAVAVAFVPFLVVGGLLVLDIMRAGGSSPSGGSYAQQPAPTMMRQAPTMPPPTQVALACPACGVPVAASDAFCPSCGTNLRQAMPAMAAQTGSAAARVCTSCGTANPAGYTFCKRCGSRLV